MTTTTTTQTIRYDDAIVRKFVTATFVWGAVGMLVGLWCALQLAMPRLNFAPYFTFGRLRPLHTNAVIFAFAGNAIFAAVYYSTQRLLKARLARDRLSQIHFWGWQAIIVAAAITLPLGFTQGKEYAELEWPIDIAIAVVWVAFAVNFFGTLRNRREKHLYVAIWFYIATIVTVAILHIFNNLAIPAGLFKSYSIYAGVAGRAHAVVVRPQRGRVLPDHAVPRPHVLLPAEGGGAAGLSATGCRSCTSGRWSSSTSGPARTTCTTPRCRSGRRRSAWSSRVMLWMPSWGGMINGLLTLRGAWNKVAEDPVLKFFVVGVTFYGMATFEGPLLSIKSVNALSHYTDWIIAHVHGGALGWNGFMAFGMIYWLVPRLFQTKLLLEEARDHALLDRDDRHPALRRRDVGRGHHAGPDVARVRRHRPPAVPGLPRDRDPADPDVLGARARRRALHHRPRARRLQHLQDLEGAPGDVRGARGRACRR